MNEAVLDRAGFEVISLAHDAAATDGKTTRNLFGAASGKVILVHLAPGYEWREHATPNHALVQMLSGDCEFFFGNDRRRLAPGDLLQMAPGLPHSVKAHARAAFLLTLFKPE